MAKKVIAKVSRGIVIIIHFLIAIIALMTVVPFVMGYKPVVVLSGSMEPTYPVGSMIYYKASNFEDINEGDVITFRLGGGALATHRVIQKNEETREFTTKGDNNETEDTKPIRYEEVVGKTGNIAIRYVGYVGTYIKEVPVMVALGAILILLSIFSQEKEGRAYAKNKKPNL